MFIAAFFLWGVGAGVCFVSFAVCCQMEYVDIAGLVKGASEGEGLGNKFLSHIREVDAIVEVVRCFEDDDVVHVSGAVDPVEDARTINLELALADMAQIERRMERLEKSSKGRNKEEAERSAMEADALRVINAALEEGNAARTVIGDIGDEERKLVDQLCLLTAKPLIYAANVDEMSLADGGASNALVGKLRSYAEQDGAEVVVVSAKVEAELQQLEPDEKEEFLSDLGCSEGGLPRLIGATYRNLGLRTYFTSGEKETRAWTIRRGMTAPQAAGVIHSDFEKGFIRAETVRFPRGPSPFIQRFLLLLSFSVLIRRLSSREHVYGPVCCPGRHVFNWIDERNSTMLRTMQVAFDDFIKYQGSKGAKDAGTLRLEGKEYIVQEGDVLLFRCVR